MFGAKKPQFQFDDLNVDLDLTQPKKSPDLFTDDDDDDLFAPVKGLPRNKIESKVCSVKNAPVRDIKPAECETDREYDLNEREVFDPFQKASLPQIASSDPLELAKSPVTTSEDYNREKALFEQQKLSEKEKTLLCEIEVTEDELKERELLKGKISEDINDEDIDDLGEVKKLLQYEGDQDILPDGVEEENFSETAKSMLARMDADLKSLEAGAVKQSRKPVKNEESAAEKAARQFIAEDNKQIDDVKDSIEQLATMDISNKFLADYLEKEKSAPKKGLFD